MAHQDTHTTNRSHSIFAADVGERARPSVYIRGVAIPRQGALISELFVDDAFEGFVTSRCFRLRTNRSILRLHDTG